MSLSDPAGDTAHFLSDDSEAEEPGARHQDEEAEPVSGVSVTRARLTVAILCYVNLLNYMDRFTVAGRWPAALVRGGAAAAEPRKCVVHVKGAIQLID